MSVRRTTWLALLAPGALLVFYINTGAIASNVPLAKTLKDFDPKDLVVEWFGTAESVKPRDDEDNRIALRRTKSPGVGSESAGEESETLNPTHRQLFAIVSTRVDAPVFDSPRETRRRVGSIRRGRGVLGNRLVGEGCFDRGRTGVWYHTNDGFVCSTSGYRITPDRVELGNDVVARSELPALYDWSRVVRQGAPRFSRLPAADDLIAATEGRNNGSVSEFMRGDFFVAKRAKHEHLGRKFVETIDGKFVLAEDLTPKDPSAFHGEQIGLEHALPLAFAFEGTQMVCPGSGGTLRACQTMEKHARSTIVGFHEHDGRRYAELLAGSWVPVDQVRIARTTEPPSAIPPNAKWAHFDVTEQTMVAYEGTEPVYATLISSGKPGHDTPVGLWRTERKYLSTTMRGSDENGIYHVEEVPWTMFYDGGYAVHGAYWHDTFGNTRSHGCTNLSVADARWLFYWEDFQPPESWNAIWASGEDNRAYFYFSK